MSALYDLDDQKMADVCPASDKVIETILNAEINEDGRSELLLLKLADGSIMLGIFPQGTTYIDLLDEIHKDFANADAIGWDGW